MKRYAAFLALAAGCATTMPGSHPLSAPVPPAYRIGPEDLLEIHVWSNEALSRTVTVRPDGQISLPLVDDVPAAGRTPLELKADITARLAQYMPNSNVSVIVSEVRGKVAVLGDVARPGRYELRSPTTAVEMLAQAGGLTEFASTSEILVLRRNHDDVERIRVNLGGTLANGDSNPYLLPGDIVFVP